MWKLYNFPSISLGFAPVGLICCVTDPQLVKSMDAEPVGVETPENRTLSVFIVLLPFYVRDLHISGFVICGGFWNQTSGGRLHCS